MILFKHGKPYVFEAISTVQYTPLEKWIEKGQNHHYVIKRLKNADSLLTDQVVNKIKSISETFKNTPYDLTFEWSDKKMYCSELVWKIYDRALSIQIGKLQRLKEFDLSSQAVKKKMKDRYGSKIPYDEPVISPSAMFNSELLATIEEKK